MRFEIKKVIIKYSLLFLNIFITIFSILFCLGIIIEGNYELSLINFFIAFTITVLIFLTYILYKVVECICSYIQIIFIKEHLDEIIKENKINDENKKG